MDFMQAVIDIKESKSNTVIHDIIPFIQAQLKAPKGQVNSFGGYNYRSCEDIVEAVKPLLTSIGFYLNILDEIVMLGDRFYIKAIASICYKDQKVSSTAYAREPESKKGMSPSQLTGTASSYARKYALNGLLAIDDTKDADTNEYNKPDTQVKTDGKMDKLLKSEF